MRVEDVQDTRHSQHALGGGVSQVSHVNEVSLYKSKDDFWYVIFRGVEKRMSGAKLTDKILYS